jgi:excisionase family DNA binding protein
MSLTSDSGNCFRTKEMCKAAGISRSTYLRWVKEGVIEDVKQWDRRGWRLFTPEDVARIKNEAGRPGSGRRQDASL